MACKLTSELIVLARTGANINIDASDKLTSDIVRIASELKNSKGKLIIRNASKKLTSELVIIAQTYPNGVELVF